MEIEDINSFLESIGEQRYKDLFKENEIDFELLMDLSEKHLKDTFKEIGLKIGTQMKILSKINSLKTKGTACEENEELDDGESKEGEPASSSQSASASVAHEQTKHTRLMVAAIDFGTHGSGLVFCFKADYHKDYRKIQSFNSASNVITKIPTTVLMKPNGKHYDSVGEEAETKFMDMEIEEKKKYYLFKRFKMMLFNNKNLSETTTLKDINDKELPAINIFAAVIAYFRKSLQKKLAKSTHMSPLLTYDDVYWVITVPAIWDLRAKQFMRKAAEKAGLKDSQVTLALEPEVASMYCRRIPVEISTQRDGAKQIASLQAGSKYLVVDLGGGTIDITAHEVMDDGGLKELHHASGGYYGGTCVNDDIMAFFKRLFGAPVLMDVKDNNPDDYFDLMKTIEEKKCSYKTSADQKRIALKIPVSLFQAYENDTGCKLGEVIDSTPFAKDISTTMDKIFISKTLFKTFFDRSIENVVKTIKEILDTPKMSDVNILLLVGGYAESPLLTETLTSAFSHKKVIVPASPSLSVLEGAIIYGFEPEMITSRVCRYTYGIATLRKWTDGDPESKKLQQNTVDKIYLCDDYFDKHVEMGQVVKVGEFQKERVYFPVKGQETALLDFYASNQRNPRFVDDPGCSLVGYFVLNLSKSCERVLVKICFGGTELNVETREEKTGRPIKSNCNFLP